MPPVVRWDEWLSPGHSSRREAIPALALMTLVCNSSATGPDAEPRSAGWQVVRRATFLRWSLAVREHRSGRRKLDKVALAHGLNPLAMARLAVAGWRVLDISRVPAMFAPMYQYQPGHHWPRAGNGSNVAPRKDGGCTSMKFLAWNLSSIYERILFVDSDVCIASDPLAWMHRHRNEYFAAQPETNGAFAQQRGYLGLTTHLMLLQPSPIVFRLLVDQGVSQSYVPFTNTEQDVLETVFSPHRHHPPPMRHRHHFSECLGHNVSREGCVTPALVPTPGLDEGLDFTLVSGLCCGNQDECR